MATTADWPAYIEELCMACDDVTQVLSCGVWCIIMLLATISNESVWLAWLLLAV